VWRSDYGKLGGALREPSSSRFSGDVFSQKGRKAVGYGHRSKDVPRQSQSRVMMAAKHKVTVSRQPTNRWPSTAERRAAQVASLSTKQAELKQEAAERRAERASQNAPAASMPRKAAAARRTNSR